MLTSIAAQTTSEEATLPLWRSKQRDRCPASKLKHTARAGDEFYIKAWPELEGRTFNEVLISFPAATPVGLKLGSSGTIVLNPESDYVLETGAPSLGTRLMSGLQIFCMLPLESMGTPGDDNQVSYDEGVVPSLSWPLHKLVEGDHARRVSQSLHVEPLCITSSCSSSTAATAWPYEPPQAHQARQIYAAGP